MSQWSYFLRGKKMWWSTKFLLVLTLHECLLMGMVGMCGIGRGGCVGKTFQSENGWLTLKGLITHIPLASNRTTSHVGAVCVFGERWCGYMNHAVTSADGEMPLSMSLRFEWLFSVPHISTRMLTYNCVPQREKKIEDKYFLTFLSFKVYIFFQDIFSIPQITNFLVFLSSDKKEQNQKQK